MRWKTVLLLGAIVLLYTSFIPQDPLDPICPVDRTWMTRYPTWLTWPEESQQEVIKLYNVSQNKHAWFQDSFPQPERKVFYLYPKGTLLKTNPYEK